MDDRTVSRRTFLRAGMAVGAGIAVSLVTACGGAAPQAAPSTPAAAAKAANNAPDLTSIDETFEDTLWKNKALLPIPASVMNVREEMGAKVGDLYKLPPGSGQGEYFGLPNGTFGGVLYYNQTLLDELKITADQIPNKWDDFIKWAKDVTVWKGDSLERTGFAIYGTED